MRYGLRADLNRGWILGSGRRRRGCGGSEADCEEDAGTRPTNHEWSWYCDPSAFAPPPSRLAHTLASRATEMHFALRKLLPGLLTTIY